MKPKILAIIPARGGSKSIPRKNLTLLGDKPLIAHTIQVALAASSITKAVVITDDLEIANVSRLYNAEVPLILPSELAQDESPITQALMYAIPKIQSESEIFEYLLLLQPTSPFRSVFDIETAIESMLERHSDSLVSVSIVDRHPYWMKIVNQDGYLENFFQTTQSNKRRQDLPVIYALNGAIYLIKLEKFLISENFYTENTLAYIMPPERSLDIDRPWDLHLANLILSHNSVSSISPIE